MNLREWLFHNRITVTQLAKDLGISRTHLNLISSGQRRPSPDLAKRIEEITKNGVTKAELLFPEDFE
ncbi:MAG: helix-turn-helix domain-containing protein [Pseudomonadota bacterium]